MEWIEKLLYGIVTFLMFVEVILLSAFVGDIVHPAVGILVCIMLCNLVIVWMCRMHDFID